MSQQHRFEKEYKITSDLDFVWECITDEDTCGLWQGQDCEIELKVGGDISLFGGSMEGKITKLEENKVIQYTWRADTWRDDWQDSLVTYTFSEEGENVIINLVHENFPNEEERNSHAMGWDSYFFEPMIEFINKSS